MEKGYCKKHGDVPLWIVCKHVGYGKAENIVISPDQDALCFECSEKREQLTQEDIVAMCDGCLKDFVSRLLKKAGSYENITNVVRGIEHLSARKS